MKDIMVDAWAIDDFPKGSPREVISRAFYNGLIKDDEIWLAMLRLRNELSHIYEVELAKDSARDILERYIPALAAFERDMHEVVAGLTK
jgi:nucleotidyltransferase substrate binding protein (TIGR01987 family)